MEFIINEKKVNVLRIADWPNLKEFRVFFMKEDIMIVIKGDEYKNGMFSITEDEFKSAVQKEIDKL